MAARETPDQRRTSAWIAPGACNAVRGLCPGARPWTGEDGAALWLPVGTAQRSTQRPALSHVHAAGGPSCFHPSSVYEYARKRYNATPRARTAKAVACVDSDPPPAPSVDDDTHPEPQGSAGTPATCRLAPPRRSARQGAAAPQPQTPRTPWCRTGRPQASTMSAKSRATTRRTRAPDLSVAPPGDPRSAGVVPAPCNCPGDGRSVPLRLALPTHARAPSDPSSPPSHGSGKRGGISRARNAPASRRSGRLSRRPRAALTPTPRAVEWELPARALAPPWASSMPPCPVRRPQPMQPGPWVDGPGTSCRGL
ncbi:hypothetical protein JB92DRAFT_2826614 [Gautieria morchelliformis]|nr:hypothetical protein JB92DRAFT_2826614 [Gautieria morchelliformis]